MTAHNFVGFLILVLIAWAYAAPATTTSTGKNLEVSPELFEGDMKFPQQPRGVLLRGNSVRWPNGIVPYEIRSGYSSTDQATIISAMRRLESLVAVNNRQCILFRPRISSDPYYIIIQNGLGGCWSYVGQNTGLTMNRTVSLQSPGCIYEGTIMHEFLHTLGFFHEQSRPDRDSYVQINYANIQSGQEHNFAKYDNTAVDTQNTAYDYSSVMHYGSNYFSSNGLATIEPLQAGAVIGQRTTLSAIDIQEVRLFYGCNGTGTTLAPTTTVYTATSRYNTQLTVTSPVFTRPSGTGNFYYVALRVTVSTSGSYILESGSAIDTYGYLYNNNFNPSSPSTNLLVQDDDSAGNGQFRLIATLQSTGTNILVITSYTAGITGNINVTVTGPGIVTFTPVTSSTTPATTTVRPTTPTTTTVRPTTTTVRPTTTTVRPTTTTVRPTTITLRTSTYAHQLSNVSPKFNRPCGSAIVYYYQSIRISVATTGIYTLTSSSTLDPYGILYTNGFSASAPTTNILAQNDDNNNNSQFKLTVSLTAGVSYVLVFTTYAKNTIGSFSVSATGPGLMTFTRLSS